jgi:glycosyltransferase involved in cell wall biosynthesis
MGLPDDGVVDRLCRLIPATGALGCSEFVAREQRARVRHPVVGVPLAADVPPGVAEILTQEMKKRLGLDPSRPLVGIVGRLQRWKGMHVYLRAMSEVAKRFPEVQGVVVGGKHDLEPDYPEFLESILREEGLKKVVRMVGRQTNVPDWMQAMDVVVHASEREPFGIVVVEAMALRKPVIATKPGGPEEIITHGEDGLLVPHGDSASLAAAICSVLENPGFASKLSLAAQERSARFTTAKYAANVASALASMS